jgi:phosphoribosyl-AMP cyclohydrolase / phosphoribosyl-ATP pyrophosphohydrolase
MRPPDEGTAPALLPVVAQDVADSRVLMLGWTDEEALEATRRTGLLHFHSRSRDRLWQKGETSGNVLRVRSLVWDCDRDALLAQVEPGGPTCHTGARSCFDAGGTEWLSGSAEGGAGEAPPEEHEPHGFAWLESLWSTIAQRAVERPAGSYTTRLLEGGVDAVARKVAEEAVEVVMAAKDDAASAGDEAGGIARSALAGEAADLLYHTLVLLAERGMEPRAVLDVLAARHAAAIEHAGGATKW